MSDFTKTLKIFFSSPLKLVISSAVILALFLRWFKLGNVPLSLYWDEIAMLADAKSVAERGVDLHGNHWLQPMFLSYGDYKLPVYIWLTTLAVKLFGATRFALRLPAALAGLGTIVILLLIAKELLFPKKKISELQTKFYLIALPLLFSPWAILFARTGFEGHVGQMLLSLAVLFLLRARKKITYLVPAQIFAVLATYAYFSVRFVWPVLMIAGWSLFVLRKEKPRQFLKKITCWLILSLIGYFLCLMPMVKSEYYEASNKLRLSTTSILNSFDFALESNILREQAGNSTISRLFYHRHWLLVKQLLQNMAKNLDFSYLFLRGDQNLRHGTQQHGLFLLPFLPFLFYGLYKLWQKHKAETLFLGCWWLVALVPAAVPMDTPHALRSLNALVPASLIIGVGVYHGFFALSKYFKILWAGWLFLALIHFTFTYFVTYPQYSAPDWQYGYQQLAEDACELRTDVDEVWVSLSDRQFFLWTLIYCDYDYENIEELQGDTTHLTNLHNVYFKEHDEKGFLSTEKKVLFISSRGEEQLGQFEAWKTFAPHDEKTYTYFYNYEK